ncbi:MAG: AAA family ATPase [Candidatus ainarchaeum sp.]|nr:AAA family ATPase [Candidatus ainarchaeum sp.]
MVSKKNNIFKEYLNSEISIFKDESVFYPDYFPENIVSRDKQISDLQFFLKPLLSKKKANNLLIFGPSGTGKTLISKFVLNQLCEFSNNIKYIYINTIQDNTRFAIIQKIVSFYKVILPRRGLAIDEVWDRLVESFKKSDFYPVIILDEIDNLKKDDCSKLLYDLSRFSYNSKFFTLILITNNKFFINYLDLRTQSSLFLTDLEFPKYTPSDLKNILLERINFGLIENAISTDLIGFVTGFAAKNSGDARIAIDLVYKASKFSEKNGFLKISKDILISCSSLVDSVKLLEKFKTLNDNEKRFFLSLKDQSDSSLAHITENIPSRSARRYLEKLDKLNLISLKDNKNGKGNSRIIIINVNRDILDF